MVLRGATRRLRPDGGRPTAMTHRTRRRRGPQLRQLQPRSTCRARSTSTPPATASPGRHRAWATSRSSSTSTTTGSADDGVRLQDDDRGRRHLVVHRARRERCSTTMWCSRCYPTATPQTVGDRRPCHHRTTGCRPRASTSPTSTPVDLSGHEVPATPPATASPATTPAWATSRSSSTSTTTGSADEAAAYQHDDRGRRHLVVHRARARTVLGNLATSVLEGSYSRRLLGGGAGNDGYLGEGGYRGPGLRQADRSTCPRGKTVPGRQRRRRHHGATSGLGERDDLRRPQRQRSERRWHQLRTSGRTTAPGRSQGSAASVLQPQSVLRGATRRLCADARGNDGYPHRAGMGRRGLDFANFNLVDLSGKKYPGRQRRQRHHGRQLAWAT